MKARILLASTLVLTILMLTHPALVWATGTIESFRMGGPIKGGTVQYLTSSWTEGVTVNGTVLVSIALTGAPSDIPLFVMDNPNYLKWVSNGTPTYVFQRDMSNGESFSLTAQAGYYHFLFDNRNSLVTKNVTITADVNRTTAPAPPSNMGVGFAFIGIGLGVAVAGIGVAFALSGQRGSEVILYGGWYYCRKHRILLWYVNGGLWCPIERRPLRTS